MILSIIVAALAIYWITLSIFGYIKVKKLLLKYPSDVKHPPLKENWKAFYRDDYSRWDRKKMVIGCFTLFPWNVFWLSSYIVVPVIFLPIILFLDSISKHRIGFKIFKFYATKIGKWMIKMSTFKIIDLQPVPQIDTPIIINNHASWMDAYVIGSRFWPISFVAKDQVAKMPIAGTLNRYFQGIYVSRSNQSNRDQTMIAINSRVAKFLQTHDRDKVFPISICPQGTVSNGKCILKFKSGAFESKCPIMMVCLKYKSLDGDFGLAMDEITQSQHVFLGMTIRSSVQVRYRRMESLEGESTVQYRQRCRKQMGEILSFQLTQAGFRDYQQYFKVLKEYRYANKKQQ